MIAQLLDKDSVLVNVEVDNWEDALRCAGEPLVKNGAIEPVYITKMIDAVKELGPYIVLDKGIALAHSRPEDGVNRIGLSLVTLKKPIEFGNPDNDPVSLIICLAAIDNTSHLEVISDLANFLSDRSNFDKLIACETVEEILDLISVYN